METLKLKIDNMKCQGCFTAVENHLNRIGGIRGIDIDKEQKTVKIHYSGDKTIKSLIIKSLDIVGYPGKEIE